jgi:hypothetical protein
MKGLSQLCIGETEPLGHASRTGRGVERVINGEIEFYPALMNAAATGVDHR